jgi:hypothetical protein
VGGAPLLDIVDDVTLRDDLEREAPTRPGWYRVVCDDLRFALWAQRRCEASAFSPEALLGAFFDDLDGELLEAGDGTPHPEHRRVVDPLGHTLAVVATYPSERERAAELVLRPLEKRELEPVLGQLLQVCRDFGCAIPAEAALHVHLDRAPWMQARRLSQLILDYSAARELLRAQLRPNPRCRRLGPFSEAIQAAAAEHRADFDSLREALRAAKPTKYVDVNLTGLTRDRPLHPTLEVRCMSMSWELRDVVDRLAALDDFLDGVRQNADARDTQT